MGKGPPGRAALPGPAALSCAAANTMLVEALPGW